MIYIVFGDFIFCFGCLVVFKFGFFVVRLL